MQPMQDVSRVSPPRHVTETPATCGEKSEGVETSVETVHAPDVGANCPNLQSLGGFRVCPRLPSDRCKECPLAGKSATGGETEA
jgi:hypothetical protein